MIFDDFNIICKKNNQKLVSDADRENPTLWSTGSAGNPVHVNFVSGVIRLPLVGISLSASETDDRLILFFHQIYRHGGRI